MKDFNPASPWSRFRAIGCDALVALKGPLGNAPAFRKAIESVLGDDASRERILDELGLTDTQQPDS